MMIMQRIREEITLFGIMMSISAFTFGGGYVVIPMMRKYFVNGVKKITEQELLDMAAIAQSTPGAIAVNLSVLVGYRLYGKRGAAISCFGTVLPPLLILTVISACYRQFRSSRLISSILKGMEAGVAAVIVDLVIDMCRGIWGEKNRLLTLLVPGAFIASALFHLNAMIIIVFCGMLCLINVYVGNRKELRIHD